MEEEARYIYDAVARMEAWAPTEDELRTVPPKAKALSPLLFHINRTTYNLKHRTNRIQSETPEPS